MQHPKGFPSRLVRLRADAGMTQKDLSKASGVSVPQIGRYETGVSAPRMTALVKLAKALGVDVSDLADADDLARDAAKSSDAGHAEASRKIQQRFIDALDRIPSDVQKQYEDAAREASMPVPDYMLKTVEERFIQTAIKLAEEGDTRGANEMRVITAAIFNRTFDLPTDD